jgi:ribosomal protein L24E
MALWNWQLTVVLSLTRIHHFVLEVGVELKPLEAREMAGSLEVAFPGMCRLQCKSRCRSLCATISSPTHYEWTTIDHKTTMIRWLDLLLVVARSKLLVDEEPLEAKNNVP